MKKAALSLFASTLIASAAHAESLNVTSASLKDGQPIPEKYAYCAPDGKGHSKDGGNISPGISWSGAPQGTKSFALIVVDPDVPANFDNANKDGKTIAKDAPRQNFYHWVLLDIPADITAIAEGKDSQKIVKEGKKPGKTAYGVNASNNYGASHGGYDGPCPPFNDERLHHYHFNVYALDTESLGLTAPSGKDAEAAIAPHILAKGELVGTYTQNPKLAK